MDGTLHIASGARREADANESRYQDKVLLTGQAFTAYRTKTITQIDSFFQYTVIFNFYIWAHFLKT